MLTEIGVNPSGLLTPDVARKDFESVVDRAVEAWSKHQQLVAVYEQQKKWSWKKSAITKGADELSKEELALKSATSDLARLCVSPASCLTLSGMRTAMEKMESMTKLIVMFCGPLHQSVT